MALSTYMTFLMHSADGSAWSKLVDIIDYSDLGGTPNMIDVSDLSHNHTKSIPGAKQLGNGNTFTCNYDPTDFQDLKARETEDRSAPSHYAVWFGGTEQADGSVTPTGADGKFSYDGRLAVTVSGGGFNEGRKMVVTIGNETDIVPKFE